MEWIDIKIWLEASTGFDRDALHIYGAIMIQFLLAPFFRRALASPWPLLGVLIAALANEYVDYQRITENPALINLAQDEAYQDMWNTMLIPIGLMLVARYFPNWLTGRRMEAEPSKQLD